MRASLMVDPAVWIIRTTVFYVLLETGVAAPGRPRSASGEDLLKLVCSCTVWKNPSICIGAYSVLLYGNSSFERIVSVFQFLSRSVSEFGSSCLYFVMNLVVKIRIGEE